VQNRRRVVYYTILLLLILGELLGERNYIIIIFPEYDTGKRKTTLEMIEEEEEIEQGNSGIREWTDEDDEIGNIVDPYYEL